MVSYRGYGQSEGAPNEAGLNRDAAAAISYAADRADVIDTRRIYLFGRSIGGAVAIAAAAAASAGAVRGLIIENSFTSIDDMIDVVLPPLRAFKFLNRNKWDSLARIKDVKVPILFISGLRDELCPPVHMRRLHEEAESSPMKEFHTVTNGSHNVSTHNFCLSFDNCEIRSCPPTYFFSPHISVLDSCRAQDTWYHGAVMRVWDTSSVLTTASGMLLLDRFTRCAPFGYFVACCTTMCARMQKLYRISESGPPRELTLVLFHRYAIRAPACVVCTAPVKALVSVRAEEVALRLHHLAGRQHGSAVRVVVRKRARHARHGYAARDCDGHDASPAVLRIRELCGKL
eukprot:IDg12877t1